MLPCLHTVEIETKETTMKNETTLQEQAMQNMELSQDTLENCIGLNNILSKNNIAPVKSIFQAHYVHLETGACGIADLIAQILAHAGAEFPAGIEATELRNIAIAGSMFTSDIIAQVQSRFTDGTFRYPEKTIRATLSVTMQKQGRIGRVKLTKTEDSNRDCDKPRFKWYLVSK